MPGDRDLSTPRSQVFGHVNRGTECRVCGRNVEDNRMVYCSEYCKNIASAVMGLLNWSSVRRRILDRDDETCQQCGFDLSMERRAREHIQAIIDERLPEQPEGPSIRALGAGEAEDYDWDAHHEAYREWRERKDELYERYGNPHERAYQLEVDHITPISEGGHSFDPGNLQTLCSECHQAKSAQEASERAERRTPSAAELNESLFEYVRENAAEGKGGK